MDSNEEYLMTVLVTGATGTVGRNVIDQLKQLDPDIAVRALTRNPEAALPEGVELAVGDLAEPGSLRGALDGIVAVHFIDFAGEEYEPLVGAAEIVALAERSGVKRATVLGGRADSELERALSASPIETTLLRPVEFMSNTIMWWAEPVKAEGIIREPYGDRVSAMIHPADIGAVAAKILVGTDMKEDATCVAMAGSALESPRQLPGRPVLGFVACAAVLRRSAFLEVGGFHERLGVGNEEQLLALDLAQAGWSLAYVPEVVARHDPHTSRDPLGRRSDVARNTLWIGWLRRPLSGALRSTMQVVRQAFRDPSARAGLFAGLRGLGSVLRERRPTSHALERALRKVEP
jgi:uncharacterized protein YbjT (DUF2867 family)